MRKNLNLRLFALLLLSMLAISYFAVSEVQAQALIWARTSNPTDSDDAANDVAVGLSGVYIVGDQGWRVQKRSLTTGSHIWTKIRSGDKGAHGVALDSSGLYVVGANYDTKKWLMEKRSFLTGALVWSAANNAIATGDVAISALSVAVHRTGLYVVGYDCIAYENTRWRIEKRSLTTGRLIWTRISNPSNDEDDARAVAVDDTGLYVVGYDNVLGARRWRIEKRSLATGSLIWTKVSSSISWANDVAVDNSGLYVVGRCSDGPSRIEKRSLATGALMWVKTSTMSAYGVAVAGSRLYMVGSDSVPRGEEANNLRWRVAKRSAVTGALVWDKATDLNEGYEEAFAAALDRTGLYIVGYDSNPRYEWDQRWRIEKRGL